MGKALSNCQLLFQVQEQKPRGSCPSNSIHSMGLVLSRTSYGLRLDDQFAWVLGVPAATVPRLPAGCCAPEGGIRHDKSILGV